MYQAVVKKMLEHDKPLKSITIQNLGYDPKIVEGAIKMAEIISKRTVFPHLINRKFEVAIEQPTVRCIFVCLQDYIDFARFIVHNMLQNIHDKYIISPKRDTNVTKLKTPGKSFKCLVDGCTRVCPSYPAMLSHLTRSKEKKHVKAVKEFDDESKIGKFGMSRYDALFEILNEDDVLKNLPVQYFNKSSDGGTPKKRVRCHYCTWSGTYAAFRSHHIESKHREMVENITPGPLCKYQFACEWIDKI